jgi:hypothetical protein
MLAHRGECACYASRLSATRAWQHENAPFFNRDRLSLPLFNRLHRHFSDNLVEDLLRIVVLDAHDNVAKSRSASLPLRFPDDNLRAYSDRPRPSPCAGHLHKEVYCLQARIMAYAILEA